MKGTEEAVLAQLVPSEVLVWKLGLLVQLPFGCRKKIVWWFFPIPWQQCQDEPCSSMVVYLVVCMVK